MRLPSISGIAVDRNREVILDILSIQRRNGLIHCSAVLILPESQRVLIPVEVNVDHGGVLGFHWFLSLDGADMEAGVALVRIRGIACIDTSRGIVITSRDLEGVRTHRIVVDGDGFLIVVVIAT